MPRVYSTSFHQSILPALGNFVYTVPAGHRAVLKDLDAYVNASLSQLNQFFYGSGSQLFAWFTTDIETTVVHQWRGRMVLYEGEHFACITDGECHISANGFLFEDPGQDLGVVLPAHLKLPSLEFVQKVVAHSREHLALSNTQSADVEKSLLRQIEASY